MHTLSLGLAQLILWGTSFYSIGIFGPHFEADLMFSKEVVYGGFSAALVAMALVSPAAGTLVHKFGGCRVMIAGAVLAAAATAALVPVASVPAYYAAWVVRGIAMRLTLYDAAFATLAQRDDRNAARAMSQITLLGGLASSVFWPLGQTLVSRIGFDDTIYVYAGFSLACTLLLLPLRGGRKDQAPDPQIVDDAAAGSRADAPPLAIILFAVIVTSSVFLLAGVSSQLIPILIALGNTPKTAAWVAAFMGFGQVTSRLIQVAFGHRIDAVRLNFISAGLVFVGFSCGLMAGMSPVLGFGFALLYGAGHGLNAIVRGTLPLLLFDQRSYAQRVGRLIVPGFLFSAAAPAIYAFLMDEFGQRGTVAASWLLAGTMVAVAMLLQRILKASGPPRRAAVGV